METKIIKVTDKGQISLPVVMRESANINAGDSLILIQRDNKIILQKVEAIANEIDDCTTWLQLLMSHCIEPKIGKEKPIFIYDFPIMQAALAQITPGDPPVAARFEVYYHGLELANGFYELSDAIEQRKRFEENLSMRAKTNLPIIPIDYPNVQALH